MITIGDKYAIQADDKQFVLVEKKVKGADAKAEEVGKEYFAQLGFYRTIGDVCVSLVRRLMREEVQNRDMTIMEAATAYQDVQRCVDEWARGIAGEMEG